MKKNIVIAACFTILLLRGMEHEQKPQPYSIVIKNTQIFLVDSPLHQVDSKIGIVATGRRWQRKLQQPSYGDNIYVGSIEYFDSNASVLFCCDCGKATPKLFVDSYAKDKELWKVAERHQIHNPLLQIVEPWIAKKQDRDQKEQWYYFVRRNKNQKEMLSREEESTVYCEKALNEALIDLGLCYSILLAEGIKKLKELKDREKSIALSILGGHMGFLEDREAPILVKAIIDFIEENASNKAGSYKKIYLYTSGYGFDWYKKYFDLTITVEIITKKETTSSCVIQ